MKRVLGLAAAAVVVAVLAIGATALVRSDQTPTALATASGQGAGEGNSGAVHQGIAVRGHWTIEVKNPDGTLAQRREFDNALQAGGKSVIKRLLTRQSKVAVFTITYGGSTPSCLNAISGLPGDCRITQVKRGDTALPETTSSSYNLAVIETADGVRLAGSKVAARDGNISSVGTTMQECFWERTEAECLQNDSSPVSMVEWFTFHPLASQEIVQVVSGQQVLVTVDLTFTAAP